MEQAAQGCCASSLVSSFKGSSFYSNLPSVTDMQCNASYLWPATDSVVGNSSFWTGGFLSEVVSTSMGQPHPQSSAMDRTAQLKFDFVDHDLLSYSAVTGAPEVAPLHGIANMFQVDNAVSAPLHNARHQELRGSIQDGHYPELQHRPSVSACTGLLDMLTLLPSNSGGSHLEALGKGPSMLTGTRNGSTAFTSSSSPASTSMVQSTSHGASVVGVVGELDYDPRLEELLGKFRASRDLHQSKAALEPEPVMLLPVISSKTCDSSQLATNVHTFSHWGQPLVEPVSSAYFEHEKDLGEFLNKVDPEDGIRQLEASCAAHVQQTQASWSEHSVNVAMAGETSLRQNTVEAAIESVPEYEDALGSGRWRRFGQSGENCQPAESWRNTVPKLDMDVRKLPGCMEVKSRLECGLQALRVNPFPVGHPASSVDGHGPQVVLPVTGHGQQQLIFVKEAEVPAGFSPGNGLVAIDLCPAPSTQIAAHPSKSRNVLTGHHGQRKLQPKLAPVLDFRVGHAQRASGEKCSFESMASADHGGHNLCQRPSKDLVKADDHVERERRRRDIMNTGFRTLESLLPTPISRRDRYGIIEDTMTCVKELERLVYYLKIRAASCRQRLQQQQIQKQPQLTSVGSCNHNMAANACVTSESDPLNGSRRAKWSGNIFHRDSEETSQDSNVEVIVPNNGPHVAIVVECRPNFTCGGRLFGGVVRGIEKLNLEVSQCSVTKCADFFICTAACKQPQHQGLPMLPHDQILQQLVASLRSYLQASQT